MYNLYLLDRGRLQVDGVFWRFPLLSAGAACSAVCPCLSVPGHLVGPVLCHSFCNYMGFPALSSALEHPQRLTLLASYLLGMLLFLLMLFPLTEPRFYGDPTPVCSLAAGSSSVCS